MVKSKYTTEEKKELVQKIMAAKKNGLNVKQACNDAGIAWHLFYDWRRNFWPTQKSGSKKTKTTRPTLIEVPIERAEHVIADNVTAFYGKPKDVISALLMLRGN